MQTRGQQGYYLNVNVIEIMKSIIVNNTQMSVNERTFSYFIKLLTARAESRKSDRLEQIASHYTVHLGNYFNAWTILDDISKLQIDIVSDQNNTTVVQSIAIFLVIYKLQLVQILIIRQ